MVVVMVVGDEVGMGDATRRGVGVAESRGH